ncbi:MAG: hypothetical protein B7Z75_00765 [Acidocella sp. 20-57-95]|nr:MAG: hypothetical protein B7Z75_00765 [Acidocella sp. 20-57-95]OYV62336.1 MAG: hypothetical protein B7Z71_01625 [Acidocella sp. 21-58-7]HQT63232.1 tyrosine-protein phosphatase [Acidocella sp.]HQU03781.1 tyrosine-protein phosphatase [Acidocella sp.]
MNESRPSALLHGSKNFRAVLPYQAADGRHLRSNILFRSGELSRLTETDLHVITQLNIKLICDLRTGREQSEFVSRWPEIANTKRLDLPNRDESDAGPHKIFELMKRHPGETGGLLAMDMLYRRKPKAFAKSLQMLFAALLQGDALPLLVHCHAGKDRTGFVVAMLLAAAGISRDDIIDDYIMSAHYFQAEHEAQNLAAWAKRSFGHEMHTDSTRPMVDTKRDYLEASLQEIDRGWGGVQAYLREAVGLTEADQTALQALLLL